MCQMLTYVLSPKGVWLGHANYLNFKRYQYMSHFVYRCNISSVSVSLVMMKYS